MDSTYLRVASTLIILVVTQQMMSGKQHCSAAAIECSYNNPNHKSLSSRFYACLTDVLAVKVVFGAPTFA